MRVHFQDALKQSPLEPDDLYYQKQKLAGVSQKFFTFMLHVLFYTFYSGRSSKQLENHCIY